MRDVTCSEQRFLALAERFSTEEGTFLLHSPKGSGGWGGASYLALLPKKKVLIYPDRDASPWELLQKEVVLDTQSPPYPLYFMALSYELGRYLHPSLLAGPYSSNYPLIALYTPSLVLKYDLKNSKLLFLCRDEIGRAAAEEIRGDLASTSAFTPSPGHWRLVSQSDTEASYLEKVSALQGQIIEGNVYQANLSQEFIFEGRESAFSLYSRLVARNPAPYSAYASLGDRTLLSLSPELFVRHRNGVLMSEPIKGTAPRGGSEEEDRQLQHLLLSSEKERAELLMITDLMRNDMARVSEMGSVEVVRENHCTAHRDIFHLSSVIRSVPRPNHPVQMLRSLFPAGSIAGCPKISALKLISELENRPRESYTGSIGLCYSDGSFEYSVAIRTLQLQDNRLKLQLGGGIVTDSVPTAEYRETLHKGRSFFRELAVSTLPLFDREFLDTTEVDARSLR